MPPLFAEDPATLTAVWVAAIAALGSLGSAIVNLLGNNAKLQYDATLVELRAEVKALREITNACHEERDELRERVRAIERTPNVRQFIPSAHPPGPHPDTDADPTGEHTPLNPGQ